MTQTLYAAQGGVTTTSSNLYSVDPVTVAQASLGTLGHAITGLAVDPTDLDSLYAVSSANSSVAPRHLLKVSLATVGVTDVGALGATVADICFDSTGQLYGWKPATNKLTLIAKATGVCTDRGASGISGSTGNGLACDSTDTIWLFPSGSSGGDLYTVDKTSGVGSHLGIVDGSGLSSSNTIGAASFSSGDVLYGVVISNPSILFTVGAISSGVYPLVQVGLFTGGAWDALAFLPSGDVTPPTLLSISALASTVTLTYDEPLAGSSLTSEYAVTVNGGARSVTAAAIAGSTVLLTLASPVHRADTVLVSYTA